MDQKILFLDLDGTLLNDQKEITPGNRQALERALKAGHGVVITTGRPLSSALEQARRLGLDGPGCYVIAFNGGVIYDCGGQTRIFQQALEREPLYALFDEANRRGVHVQTYDANDVLVEPRCDDDEVRRYGKVIRVNFRVIGDVRRDLTEPAVKALLIDSRDPAPLLSMKDWVERELAGQADCFFSCGQYLEIVPPGLNKGTAVRMLCKALGVPIERSVAAGDASNDIAMLRAAGVGVCMVNGTDEAKAAADAVTKRDNNHDGVAEIVETYLLS